ncbi:MAG: glycosyltransferase [Flavobacteriaceae bacterium]|nr:glycosyltransferase [Flavobacteriaceae bacterium]
MKKKNILIISYTYPPSNAPAAQRPYALAKYLDKNKYDITVITCSNADSSMGFDASFNEELKDVKLIKIASKYLKNTASLREGSVASSNIKTGLKQKVKSSILSLASRLIIPDKAIFWFLNVKKYFKYHPNLISQTDIIFTTSPLFSNHLAGLYIKKKNPNAKWITDFRDFHYVENWAKKEGIFAKYHKKLESKIIKKADIITFISSAMKDVYADFYKTENNKFNFVYNGYDPDDFNSIEIQPVSNNKLTIFYAGSFYKGVRSPFPLLKLIDNALEKGLLEKEEITIKIAGNFEVSLLDEAKTYQSFSCIEFLGRLPRTQVLKEFTKADLLWLIVGNKITHYTGVPIKFYEYLAVRRPIINFAPALSEPTKIIDEYQLGWSFDEAHGEIENFQKFEKIATSFKNGELKKPLSEKLISKFTRDNQSKLFEQLIDG